MADDSPQPAGDGAPSVGSFDPTPYVKQIRTRGGNVDYLGAEGTIAWFRHEHPDWTIDPDVYVLDDEKAIFQTRIADQDGRLIARGWGSETRADFPDYAEKAESKSIRRALRHTGYALAPDDEPADSPQARQDAPGRADGGARAQPMGGGANVRQGGQGRAGGPLTAWGDFWKWARELGYENKPDLEHRLGIALPADPQAAKELVTQTRRAKATGNDPASLPPAGVVDGPINADEATKIGWREFVESAYGLKGKPAQDAWRGIFAQAAGQPWRWVEVIRRAPNLDWLDRIAAKAAEAGDLTTWVDSELKKRIEAVAGER